MIFFPVEIAIALTGVVHFLNNIFKSSLVGKNANWSLVVKFSLTAIPAAFVGAWLLKNFSFKATILVYDILGHQMEIKPANLLVGTVMIVFVILEMSSLFEKFAFKKNGFFIGGLVSGFFGGLTGHQGALRSAFLIKAGLDKVGFIATGILIACVVDVTRLSVYFSGTTLQELQDNLLLLVSAVLSAFLGAYLGNRWLKKITLKWLNTLVSISILLFSLGLIIGLI